MSTLRRLLIVADDLSGAAETAAAAGVGAHPPAQVWLGRPRGFDAPVVAVDTGARSGTGSAVSLSSVIDQAPAGTTIYQKVDSLLRGDIAGNVRELRGRGLPVVVATAAPRIGRTVRSGVVHLGGTPLHETDAWSAEPGRPPRRVADAIDAPHRILSPAGLPAREVAGRIEAALADGVVPICDTESERDLDTIADALRHLDPDLVVVGSAGLARSMGRHLSGDGASGSSAPPSPPAPPGERVVSVVGTRTASGRRQVQRLVRLGAALVELTPGTAPRLGLGDTVLTVHASAVWDTATLAAAFTGLARAIEALPGRSDLVLTGGDTARTVLEALGVGMLTVLHEVHDGAVLSATPTGRRVVTRPGSYGSDDSLVHLVHHLKGLPS